MKNLRTAITGLCLLFSTFSAVAQDSKSPINEPDRNKPLLFAGLPDRIPVSIDYINSLFDSEEGRGVSLAASATENTDQIEGVVVSSGKSIDGRSVSVMVRSTNFNGANFQVSRYTDVNGKVSYAGRIISFRHGDAYELKMEVNNLVLVKRNFRSLLME